MATPPVTWTSHPQTAAFLLRGKAQPHSAHALSSLQYFLAVPGRARMSAPRSICVHTHTPSHPSPHAPDHCAGLPLHAPHPRASACAHAPTFACTRAHIRTYGRKAALDGDADADSPPRRLRLLFLRPWRSGLAEAAEAGAANQSSAAAPEEPLPPEWACFGE